MRRIFQAVFVICYLSSPAFAQGLNKIVFGPLEGDGAGVLTVHNGEDIEVEVWIRTDPSNPGPVIGMSAGLMSDNDFIAQRNCVDFDPEFSELWDDVYCDGPFVYNPDDYFPVTPGHTTEMIGALCVLPDCPGLDTDGDWLFAGSFLMTCNTGIEPGNTYYPLSDGWYPNSGQGSVFSWEGGGSIPETDFCGLYFEESGQDLNKIVFGPLEGDNAGMLTVRNGDAIEVEVWVRTDPDNPGPVTAIVHGLLSENIIIAERNGAVIEPYYDHPNWPTPVGVDGPFVHNPDDPYPIPEGHTCEMQYALHCDPFPCEGDWLDTQGEWDLYGTWLMVTNTEIPIEQTYYPFAEGWYPHSGNGTAWGFDYPPYGVIPLQDFCGLYFVSDTCVYIPGDVNGNGSPLELSDVVAMIGNYRGTIEPYYTCTCTEGSPYLGFAATADPNGNCIPLELNDVVTEIGAYRGTGTASGCPDCPGE